MPDFIKFFALVFVYFLIIYLVAIRRKNQSLLVWLFLILQQAASLYYFQTFYSHLRLIPFFAPFSDTVCTAVTAGFLVLINSFVILLVNFVMQKKERASVEHINAEVRVEDIPITTSAREETPPLSGINFSREEPPVQPRQVFDEDEKKIFASINDLIEKGQKEEAVKYLRMVAYFGTNEQSMNQAKQMLNELQND